MTKAYHKSIEKLTEELHVSINQGLSKEEAKKRLHIYGFNTLPEKKPSSLSVVFLQQFQNPLIYILLIAAAIIFFLGYHLDAFIISGVLFFNAIIGTIQEGRTRNIVESLKRYLKSDAIVIRDGQKHIISDENLVPGDIIALQEGEKVPADARIIQSNDLSINEAMLTGESTPVYKKEQVLEGDLSVHDQTNMVFKGTFVLSGSGKAIVIATGVQTEAGKLNIAIEKIQTETPLQKSLDQLAHWILLFILGMCIFMFIYGLLIGKSYSELLVMLTALFICVIPEGLPVVLTLTLVSGAYRMAKKNVLIKRMQAVEGLGRANVLVIDKTGTLTRNEMMVSNVYADNTFYTVTGQGYRLKGNVMLQDKKITIESDSPLMYMSYAAALLNRSEKEYIKELDIFQIKGDPTEAAMYTFAEKIGLETPQDISKFKVLFEMPFTSEKRYAAGFYENNNDVFCLVIGAPEVVFKRSDSNNEKIKHALEQFLQEGLRVVAVAMKKISKDTFLQTKKPLDLIQHKLTLLGLFGIQDTIRQEVPEMVQKARDAGLRIVMATGDHLDTALFVAKRVGIYKNGNLVMNGDTLEKISEKELDKEINNITVFSRVRPEQKIKIIDALRKEGNIVAMTGDGVNDAPSLVAADLGIAMGNIGTEVAKHASDMILLDDSFSSIILAIEEGRNIFYALRRVILYFFTTNMGEVLVVLFALLLNLPLPILAAQILWLNLVTDGFLDAALSMEPQEKGLLKPEFREEGKRLVDKGLLFKTLYMAIPMGIGSLLVFYYYIPAGLKLARTMTLTTMAMFQWFNAWNCRSERLSVFQLKLLSNKWLVLATTLVLGLQIFILHNPFMQKVFRTTPITFNQWLLVLAVSSSIFFIEEIRKFTTQYFFNKN